MRKILSTLFCLVIFAVAALAANPVPFVNQPLAPADAVPGGAAFTLTVNGCMFVPGAVINWDGQPLPTAFVSPLRLTAAVPAALIAEPNTAAVTVTNPGTSAASNVVYFPVARPRSQLAFTNAPGSPILLGSPTEPPAAMAVAAGDFTGDGKLDLAVALFGSPSVLQVLLGNGNGTFTVVPTQTTVGMNPLEIAVGDFNGDGKPDLAVVNTAPSLNQATTPSDLFNSVSILLGNGNGTFTNAPGSPVPVGFSPVAAAVGDFNGDGKLDLAVLSDGINLLGTDHDATLTILLGNGNGTFTEAPDSPIDLGNKTLPDNFAVGDFNGDGKLDIAIPNYGTDTVTVLLGNGNGTFTQAPGSPIPLTVTVEPEEIAAGDFTGNGKLDLAVGGWLSDSVDTLLGNGDGTFTEQTTCCEQLKGVGSALNDFGMGVGDFYGDGHLDLAMGLGWGTGNAVTGLLTFVHGNGNANPVFTRGDYSTETYYALKMLVGDFNNDGEMDVVTAGEGAPGQISVLLQSPSQQAPDFAIKTAGNTTATVSPGGTATYNNLQVASMNGFFGDVSLTCSGQPVNATCSISPTPTFIADTATASNITLTVQTAAPTTPGVVPPVAGPGGWTVSLLAMLLVLAGIASVRQVRQRCTPRRPAALVPLVVLLFSVTLLATCGSGPGPGPSKAPPSGTPPGTYTIIVTAASGSISHSQAFTLTVQ